jgi:hypothetical protein
VSVTSARSSPAAPDRGFCAGIIRRKPPRPQRRHEGIKLCRTRLTAIVAGALTAVLLTAGGAGAGPAVGPARAGAVRASVPWKRVGTGWVLTQYSSAAPDGLPRHKLDAQGWALTGSMVHRAGQNRVNGPSGRFARMATKGCDVTAEAGGAGVQQSQAVAAREDRYCDELKAARPPG